MFHTLTYLQSVSVCWTDLVALECRPITGLLRSSVFVFFFVLFISYFNYAHYVGQLSDQLTNDWLNMPCNVETMVLAAGSNRIVHTLCWKHGTLAFRAWNQLSHTVDRLTLNSILVPFKLQRSKGHAETTNLRRTYTDAADRRSWSRERRRWTRAAETVSSRTDYSHNSQTRQANKPDTYRSATANWYLINATASAALICLDCCSPMHVDDK